MAKISKKSRFQVHIFKYLMALKVGIYDVKVLDMRHKIATLTNKLTSGNTTVHFIVSIFVGFAHGFFGNFSILIY